MIFGLQYIIFKKNLRRHIFIKCLYSLQKEMDLMNWSSTMALWLGLTSPNYKMRYQRSKIPEWPCLKFWKILKEFFKKLYSLCEILWSEKIKIIYFERIFMKARCTWWLWVCYNYVIVYLKLDLGNYSVKPFLFTKFTYKFINFVIFRQSNILWIWGTPTTQFHEPRFSDFFFCNFWELILAIWW